MPPANANDPAYDTDEDSGDEDEASINNLPGGQLRAQAFLQERFENKFWDPKDDLILSIFVFQWAPEDDIPLSSLLKKNKHRRNNADLQNGSRIIKH
nr:unnamed protein product [Callosobruchus analis]